MSAPSGLLADLQSARHELLAAIDGLSPEELLRVPPDAPTESDERWPIRDVLWHVGTYEDYLRRWVDATRRSVAVEPYAERRRPPHMETPQLLIAWLDQTRRPTTVLLDKLAAEELDAPRTDATGRETTFALALEGLAAHDREHAVQVRALRAPAGDAARGD